MNLKSLLLSSDDKTIRILRRVLSDLEISVDHCSHSETAIRKVTRERFEAIIVDCADPEQATQVLLGVKAAPVNKRALSIVLVESSLGLRGGFDMGAHFVLHKPISNERAKSSFRAVRALMKRERRRQLRIPVQIPVLCKGFRSYEAKTLDLCEGGMALQFADRIVNEESLRFVLELPGIHQKLELRGNIAWEGQTNQAGVRFQDVPEQQQTILRQWLTSQLPELEHDDPPVSCQLTELSLGACYLKTNSPFPKRTRVILGLQIADVDVRAGGVVRVVHPEFGMGVEFLQATQTQQDQVHQIIDALRSHGQESLQLQVEPDGLETASPEDSATALPNTEDPLVDLFRSKSQDPAEVFLQEMEQLHQPIASS